MACTPNQAPQSAASVSATAAGGPLPGSLATPGARAAIPDEALLQPLTALGKCPAAPRPRGPQTVDGLIVPGDAVLTSVAQAEPLTNVQGYIPQTPVQVRVFYQQHPDLTVLSVEDEIQESEVLTEAGGYRVFVKAKAVCELGSVFVAVIAPAAQP